MLGLIIFGKNNSNRVLHGLEVWGAGLVTNILRVSHGYRDFSHFHICICSKNISVFSKQLANEVYQILLYCLEMTDMPTQKQKDMDLSLSLFH